MLTLASRTRGPNERGAIAIIMATSLTALLVVVAMVLDFGLARQDRQINKSAADSAVTAGLRAADRGTDAIHSFRAVCSALEFLKTNLAPDLDGLSYAACTPANFDKECSPTDSSTWARFTASINGYAIRIESPHVPDPTEFPEENLATLAGDQGEPTLGGCDQLAVIVTRSRQPGLGSIASTEDITSTIRSVGRVGIGPGRNAPAMLLLRRTGCPILQTGSNAGGSYIHVYGAVSSSGHAQAGTIHADSDGSSCSSSILAGRGTDGIVAYAAPLVSNTGQPDPSKPGQISTVAGTKSLLIGTIRDSATNVYGSSALDEAGAASATKVEPVGRGLVTRQPVDERYLTGITNAVDGANGIFSTITSPAAAAADGYTVVDDCNPTSVPTPANGKLYINCTHNNGYRGIVPLNASTIIFNGKVNPASVAGSALSMPVAKKVYIFGASADAVTVGNNAAFTMHTSGNMTTSTSPPTCSPDQTSNKAMLFVRNGQFRQTGGLLRLCNTTVVMMGGYSNACLPALGYLSAGTPAPAPTQSPCGGVAMGTGQFTQTGGDIDWTAPNQYDAMTLSDGQPDPTKKWAWSDVNGPEDLALWSESGTNSSETYSMSGGGLFKVRGVYMAPNAWPFTLAGGANLDLRNAQYVATSIELSGNTTRVSMSVDPNSAVTIPELDRFSLVR